MNKISLQVGLIYIKKVIMGKLVGRNLILNQYLVIMQGLPKVNYMRSILRFRGLNIVLIDKEIPSVVEYFPDFVDILLTASIKLQKPFVNRVHAKQFIII